MESLSIVFERSKVLWKLAEFHLQFCLPFQPKALASAKLSEGFAGFNLKLLSNPSEIQISGSTYPAGISISSGRLLEKTLYIVLVDFFRNKLISRKFKITFLLGIYFLES